MAFIQDGRATSGNVSIETTSKAARVTLVTRGNRNHCISVQTGTVAAVAAANSTFLAMRLNPSSTLNAYIQRVRLNFTTITAFTVPVTAGRRLSVFRGTGAAASTGTALATPVPKLSSAPGSGFAAVNGGDIRYSGAAALVTTGITFESDPFSSVSLVQAGAAGTSVEYLIDFSGAEASPIVLEPGQLLAIRNPIAMDLGGTWQLSAAIHWSEDLPLTSSVVDS